MMSDRELLELAAKAVGIAPLCEWDEASGCMKLPFKSPLTDCHFWSPLRDDGDALRLAVSLNIEVCHAPAFNEAHAEYYAPEHVLHQTARERWGDDKYAATRRAIVLAAAEIGKQMQDA